MLNWLRNQLARRGDDASALRTVSSTHDPRVPAVERPHDTKPRDPVELYWAGDHQAAEQATNAALAQDEADPAALVVRGLLSLDAKRNQEALSVLRRAQALDPGNGNVQLALGRALAAIGQRPAAMSALQRASALMPTRGEAQVQLALIAQASGRHDDAIRLLEHAIRVEPSHAAAHFHLGNRLCHQGRLDQAEQHYRRAVASRPGYAEALCNLGGLLKDSGRREDAARRLEEALQADPKLGIAAFNLAMIRIDQRRWAEAADLLRASLAQDGRQADANYWLGNALMGLGDAPAACEAYRNALRLDANYVPARWGQAMAMLVPVPATQEAARAGVDAFAQELGKLKSWIRTRKPADGFRAVGAQQPYYLAYAAANHLQVLSEYGDLCASLMTEWARKVGVPSPSLPTGGKLRVGIVSAHVCSHSVWHAITRGWVEHLNPAQFELHLFHLGSARDEQTEWAERRARRLHAGLRDWQAWAKVLSDSKLDVIIYPELGMDATTVRLASLRLARVQLASWGHPITTGLPTIDAFVSAEAFEPEGAESHYRERLIMLPRLGCCYHPYGTHATQGDLAPLGIGPADRLLLCAGTPFKYAPEHDALIVEVARRCRPCKLVFFRAQPAELSAGLEARLRQAFDTAGLEFDDCVRFVPWQSQAAFFGLLDRADVYLDTAGFSGFNTAMQAVERGTPIVAWEGDFMRSRFASGILSAMQLNDWVARTAQEYVDRVERLCVDVAARDRLRSDIASRRAPLFEDRRSVDALARCLVEQLDKATP